MCNPAQELENFGKGVVDVAKDIGHGVVDAGVDLTKKGYQVIVRDPLKPVEKKLGEEIAGHSRTPTPPVDYAEQAATERRKAEADATSAANQELLAKARRKRAGSGLLSTAEGSSILASGAPVVSTVLGSGGQ